LSWNITTFKNELYLSDLLHVSFNHAFSMTPYCTATEVLSSDFSLVTFSVGVLHISILNIISSCLPICLF